MKSFFPVDRSEAKQHLSLSEDKPVLLFGAQYLNSAYKGYDILIDILKKIKFDVEIVFFGRHNPIELKKNQPGIRYLGFLESDELRKAYSAADVYISPSRMEAFGKTVAESMACGTPVVCFDKTGSSDIIDHKINGYLAISYQIDDMIKGVQYVLNKQNKKSIREEAIKKVEQNYGADTITKKYLELYQQLLQ
ncbi:MAG: glycosyltransferase [Balneolaceae bacterium]|nr:glycosyltransferase [Balneolaceae bacterium]